MAYRDPRRVLPGYSYSISSGIDQIIDVDRARYRRTRKNFGKANHNDPRRGTKKHKSVIVRPKPKTFSLMLLLLPVLLLLEKPKSCRAEHGDLGPTRAFDSLLSTPSSPFLIPALLSDSRLPTPPPIHYEETAPPSGER